MEKARENYHTFSDYKRRWLLENSNSDWHKLDNRERLQFINMLFKEIIVDFIRKLPDGPLVLGFSSGLDSRFIYQALKNTGVRINTYTYGQQGDCDYELSKVISYKLGLDTEYIDTSEIDWSLEWYDNNMNLVNDTVLSPRYMASKNILDKTGLHHDIHGYLNDSIVGKNFKCNYIPDDWEAAINNFIKKNNTFELQSYIEKSLVVSFLPSKPFTNNTEMRYQHQLDLAFRQEQRIRPKDHAGIKYLLPFTDWRWIGFWLSRENHELSNRTLYREFIASLESEIIFDVSNYKYNQTFDKKNGYDKKVLPKNPNMHFCMYSCYRNNPSFRQFVDTAVGRMKKRRLIRKRFIEKTMRRFLKNQNKARKQLLGIVSTDIAIESGMF